MDSTTHAYQVHGVVVLVTAGPGGPLGHDPDIPHLPEAGLKKMDSNVLLEITPTPNPGRQVGYTCSIQAFLGLRTRTYTDGIYYSNLENGCSLQLQVIQ